MGGLGSVGDEDLDLSAEEEEEAAAASQGEEEEEEDAGGSSSETLLITDNRSGNKKMCALTPSIMPALCSLCAACGLPAAGCARWRNQLVQTMKRIISAFFFFLS